jgi:hypothetical protein
MVLRIGVTGLAAVGNRGSRCRDPGHGLAGPTAAHDLGEPVQDARGVADQLACRLRRLDDRDHVTGLHLRAVRNEPLGEDVLVVVSIEDRYQNLSHWYLR